jgi:arylsulfatase A-like enzyme
MPTEAEHSQTRTVDAGLHFLDTNADADRWMLQIELFDPHEPFFTHDAYKSRYPHRYGGPAFDWPGYQKVTEPQAQVEHARQEYAALVSMCDRSLGRGCASRWCVVGQVRQPVVQRVHGSSNQKPHS